MTKPTPAFGGSFSTIAGMLLSSADIGKIGGIANQSLLHVLAMLFFDDSRDQPKDGFIGDGFEPSAGGAPLEVDIKAGVGFQWDGGFSDPFGPDYKPVVQAADETLTFARPGTSTHSRIDVLSVEAGVVGDESAVRNAKDVSTGVISASSVNTRSRWEATITVTEGTPSTTPTTPTAPSGHMVIGHVLVPSTSSGGSVVVSDYRPRLFGLGSLFENDPGPDYSADFIPGSGTELEVTPDTGLAVAVAAGSAVINGQRSFYGAQVLGLAAAPTGALHRWDTVYATPDGTLGVSKGVDTVVSLKTPGAVPTGAIALSQYNVTSGATAPTQFEDLRVREPYTGSHLQQGTVTAGNLQDPDAYMLVSPTGVTGTGYVEYDFQLKDSDGYDLARDQQFLLYITSDTFGVPADAITPTIVGSGTINNSGNDRYLITTDSNGLAEIRLTRTTGGVTNLLLRVEPVVQNGADRNRGAVSMDSTAV